MESLASIKEFYSFVYMMDKYQEHDLLQYAIEHDMIDLSYVQNQINMDRRKQLLKKHPYKIWEGKDGKWRTYLPDQTSRRLIKRSTRESVEDAVVEYYKSSKVNYPSTFDDVYWMWRKIQDELVDSPNTPIRYNTDYERYFRLNDFSKSEIGTINEDDIKIFMHRTIKNLRLCKKATKTLFGYLKRVFKCAKMNRLIELNPTEYLSAKDFYKYCIPSSRSQKIQIVSDDDMSKLNHELLKDYINKPWYIPAYAVVFASLTGMRVGEISALRWEDVNDGNIIIRNSEKYDRKLKKYFISSTKNDKIRIFPITEEIRKLFKSVKEAEIKYGYYCEWVFANESGRIHAPVISSCIKNKCRMAGISEKGIHALRKTLNSKMRHNGVSKSIASSLLGHTEAVNEEYYTFDVSSIEEKKLIVSKINQDTRNCI